MSRPTPPKLLPLPPRTARRTAGGGGCGRVFLVPFVVVGLATAVAVPLRLWVEVAGLPITATVDDLTAHHGRRGGVTYTVRFRYELAGRPYTDTQEVTAGEYAAVRRGQQLHGRTRILDGHSLAITDAGSGLWQTAKLAAFAAFWNGFIGWIVYAAVVAPWRVLRLVRTGVAVPGTVISHREAGSKRTLRFVTYRFTTRDRRELTREMSVVGTAGPVDGTPVTVLYDPNRPTRSVAYEFAGVAVG